MNIINWASPSLLKLAAISGLALAITWAAFCALPNTQSFEFALLGDRTGEVQPGAYPEAWREAVAEHPAFVLTVGDSIQGYNDNLIEIEWRELFRIIAPFRRYPLFLTPGNHDVWDQPSAAAYVKYSHHPLHYSFDWHQAHFTILNDSESDNLNADEIAFLEKDLAAHRSQPVKFIVSHRPAWLLAVVLRNPDFPLHKLALKYGVKYVIAGHIHQMLRLSLDGITYLSMPSAGGHLREDKQYKHGWFFAHTSVFINGSSVRMQIHELDPPFGKARVTDPSAWGAAGLLSDLGI